VPEVDTEWSEILRQAVGIEPAQPIVGSRFRKIVSELAAERGRSFPPEGESALKFIQLLERWPEIVSIMRRPGQDFIVAPAGDSDVLTNEIKDQLFGIRRDLFDAFTTISKALPLYDKTQDRVVWRSGEIAAHLVTSNFVPIPKSSEEDAIQLRREFAESRLEAVRVSLIASLSDGKPLQAFGRAIKQTGLQIEWHSFRTKRVLEQLQQWANSNGIEWKAVWLTGKDDRARSVQLRSCEQTSAIDQDALKALLSSLEPADMQRISIPLDLVIKAFKHSQKRCY